MTGNAPSPLLSTKVCRDCGECKPLAEFYKNSSRGDGLFAECKDCWCARTRAYRANNDAVRERDRARKQQPHRRAALAAASREARLNNPEKDAAWRAVAEALRVGTLSKQPCVVCGEPKAQAHHADYSKPLEVHWLCARHHSQLHAELKWTRRNDEWVSVLFAIHQGPGGRYDRPAELPTYKETRK